LFIPCFIDAFFPDVGVATLELLERLGCEVDYPLDQTCCGQPMGNSGCEKQAAATENLFVRNFAGYDYIVAERQLRASRVRDHLSAADQTPDALAVRGNTYELVEFIHDVLQVRDFPWAEFPHKVGLHNSCGAARPEDRQHVRNRRPFFSAADAAQGREGHRVHRARPSRRMLRLRRHVLRLGGAGIRADGRRQGARSSRNGAEYVVSADSSCLMHQKGCSERLGLGLKFIHIASILNGARA
jgi:L-lactate dehydrogenase complex protein LldE